MVKTLPSNEGGVGSVPSQRTKISHAPWCRTTNVAGKPEYLYAKNPPKPATKTDHTLHHMQRLTQNGS